MNNASRRALGGRKLDRYDRDKPVVIVLATVAVLFLTMACVYIVFEHIIMGAL